MLCRPPPRPGQPGTIPARHTPKTRQRRLRQTRRRHAATLAASTARGPAGKGYDPARMVTACGLPQAWR
jgi:hypothetical protein